MPVRHVVQFANAVATLPRAMPWSDVGMSGPPLTTLGSDPYPGAHATGRALPYAGPLGALPVCRQVPQRSATAFAHELCATSHYPRAPPDPTPALPHLCPVLRREALQGQPQGPQLAAHLQAQDEGLRHGDRLRYQENARQECEEGAAEGWTWTTCWSFLRLSTQRRALTKCKGKASRRRVVTAGNEQEVMVSTTWYCMHGRRRAVHYTAARARVPLVPRLRAAEGTRSSWDGSGGTA